VPAKASDSRRGDKVRRASSTFGSAQTLVDAGCARRANRELLGDSRVNVRGSIFVDAPKLGARCVTLAANGGVSVVKEMADAVVQACANMSPL
jgi:hypothetical protein